jgi:hypothetical protein
MRFSICSRFFRRPSDSLLAFRRALSESKIALAAAREAAQRQEALQRQKLAYWDRLNGYEFEIATANVLKLHRFDPSESVEVMSKVERRAVPRSLHRLVRPIALLLTTASKAALDHNRGRGQELSNGE